MLRKKRPVKSEEMVIDGTAVEVVEERAYVGRVR